MPKIFVLILNYFFLNASYCRPSVNVTFTSLNDWVSGTSVNCDANNRQGQISLRNILSGPSDEFDAIALKPFWIQANFSPVFISGERLRVVTSYIGTIGGTNYGPYSYQFAAQDKMAFETLVDTSVGSIGMGGMFIDTGASYLELVIKDGNSYYVLSGNSNSYYGAIGSYSGSPIAAGITYLRIEKNINSYSCFLKKNISDSWLPVSSTSFANTSVISVGLGLHNTHSAYGPATADFEYFHSLPLADQGTWTSSPKYLTGTPTTTGKISWLEDTPTGTSVSIQTATSDDGVNWSPWSAPYADSFGSIISSPARNWIRVAATLAGEPSHTVSPILREININYPDALPNTPSLSSTSHAQSAWANNPQLDLQWSMPAGNPAPESNYTYWLRNNGNVTQTATVVLPNGSVGSVHRFGLTLSAEGAYQVDLQVQGDNFSGGVSTTVVSYGFSFDRTPPGSTVISSPTHPELLFANNNSPVFDLAATDALSGVSGYAVSLDKLNYGDPGSAINVWGNQQRYTNVENGTYYLHARAIDAAGNTGPVSHYGIRVDFNGALLSEAYVKVLPNPVRQDKAKIEYQLAAAASEVTLEFMNGTGETVTQADGTKDIGKNYYIWDVSHVANGVYFYRIKAKSNEDGKTYTVTKKIAIVR